MPAGAGLSAPCRSGPGLAYPLPPDHSRPCRTSTCSTRPRHACAAISLQSQPRRCDPCRTCRARPLRTAPRHAKPIPPTPCPPYPSSNCLSRPNPTTPRLPDRTRPVRSPARRASPCLSCLTLPSRALALPHPSGPDRAPPRRPAFRLPYQSSTHPAASLRAKPSRASALSVHTCLDSPLLASTRQSQPSAASPSRASPASPCRDMGERPQPIRRHGVSCPHALRCNLHFTTPNLGRIPLVQVAGFVIVERRVGHGLDLDIASA